jgi:hypothetical protein
MRRAFGQRASLLDWLGVFALLGILGILIYNAAIHREWSRREAEGAAWRSRWIRDHPGLTPPKHWVPEHKIHIPFRD